MDSKCTDLWPQGLETPGVSINDIFWKGQCARQARSEVEFPERLFQKNLEKLTVRSSACLNGLSQIQAAHQALE
jgi:hypothetical protein